MNRHTAMLASVAALAYSSAIGDCYDCGVALNAEKEPTCVPNELAPPTPKHYRSRDTQSPYRCQKSRAKRKQEKATQRAQRKAK